MYTYLVLFYTFIIVESCSSHDNKINNNNTQQHNNSIHDITTSDPCLIHFHDIPILILRAIPIPIQQPLPILSSSVLQEEDIEKEFKNNMEYNNIIYLSQVHCHNHKICVDTIYTISCCTRRVNVNIINESQLLQYANYDNLSTIGIEVFLRYCNNNNNNNNNTTTKSTTTTTNNIVKDEFHANDIAKILINHCLHSVLTINECLVIEINGKELVCRVSKICIDNKNSINDDEEENTTSSSSSENDKQLLSASEASLDEPFRGRITINTDFYVQTSNHDAIQIHDGRVLPEGSLPDDVIHVTTSDDEWFPVRRMLLAPCIHLTKYVQHGKGIYKNSVDQEKELKSRRSQDAPASGIHCYVNIDCCTFDRVLLFIMSEMYPDEYKFALDLSEINSLSLAAQELGLTSLSDLCRSQLSSFESRVRKDKYIRFSEIEKRNCNNELLIIIDGMVLDITRWIDEHPGKVTTHNTVLLCFFLVIFCRLNL